MASVPTTRSVGGTPHFFSPTKVRQFRRKFLDLDRAGKGRVPTADFKHIFAYVNKSPTLHDSKQIEEHHFGHGTHLCVCVTVRCDVDAVMSLGVSH